MEQGIDILNIAINLAITAVIYILPPVIYAFLIRKERLPQKSARTVCIISGLVIWFLLFFVYAALGLESGKRTIGPALIWSGVAYLIIRERNAPEGAVPEVKAEETAKSDMPEEAEPDAAAASEPESHENAALSKTPAVKKENFDLLVWAKRNIAAVVVIAVLAGALAFTIVKLLAGNNDKAEIERLNNLVKTNEEIIDGLHESEDRLKGYQDAVLNFYLDGAVVVLEDDKHYHRYNCPVTRMPSGEFRYYTFNSAQAEAEGYSKCPACFGESSEEYCKNHIENH